MSEGRTSKAKLLVVIDGAHSGFEKSEQLLNDELFNYAIIEAIIACEAAIRSLAELHCVPKATERIINSVTGNGSESPKLASQLIGVDLESMPFWVPFREAVEKRDVIVHRGEVATRSDAKKAIAAAKGMIRSFSKATFTPVESALTRQFIQCAEERMQAIGMSRNELGRRSGISPSYLRRLLSGKHSPTLATIQRLAQELELEISFVISVRQ